MPENPFYISPPESDADSDIIVEENSSVSESTILSSEYTEQDDYSLDSRDEFICEQIFRDESIHTYEDKTDKKYYIGTPFVLDDMWLIANSVSSATFYRYRYIDILHYLLAYSIVRSNRAKVEIMQLNISGDGIYKVVLKTFWLRIVQRIWKRIFRERNEMWRKRMSIGSLRHRELRGKYPGGLNVLPSICGCLISH
jgi:hypothetical protein